MLRSSQNQGMSGRALRRLPVLALARSIGSGCRISISSHQSLSQENGIIAGHNNQNVADGKQGGQMGMNDSRGRSRDVEMWLEGMENVIKDSAEGIKRFV
jgi:hypothetical protein